MTEPNGREKELTGPPPMGDAPVPGWIIGLFWTLAAWALYYYMFAL